MTNGELIDSMWQLDLSCGDIQRVREALNKLIEIEEIVQFCEGCESYHGVREYPKEKAYEHIVEVLEGRSHRND